MPSTDREPTTHLTTGDMYRLASEITDEYGQAACDFAWRAVVHFEADGQEDRAQFWYMLLILMGDIVHHRVDPALPIRVH